MSGRRTMPTRRGVQFGPAEQAALVKLHQHGLRSHRYDEHPAGVPRRHRCPCELTRATCHGERRLSGDMPYVRYPCPTGRQALTGGDHLDAWYRGRDLVAVVHYPYPSAWDETVLRAARDGCEQLGVRLDVDADWGIHNPPHTIAVIISRTGLPSVLRPDQSPQKDTE